MPEFGAEEHETTTMETGAFCLARCSCGWSGPARRARSRARTDADGHHTQVRESIALREFNTPSPPTHCPDH
ncbi:hypothetical protein [Streptomyces zagrosensis]|uniref:Uncharacterized protein n=1 Tax=Streptomyces zagrosensis TaxID=1042984 RepID=A0A7W9QH04_9ACTN|nr:hypothetical protein [Streptomyces zagrosensis]MBB5940121.1 hypothetical protein [Streptomyces zagrosensis]